VLLHTLNNSISALASLGIIPGERLEQNAAASPVLISLLAVGVLVFVGTALATCRARIVPIDPSLPVWEPPFPGVAHPPTDANAELRIGHASRIACLGGVLTSAALVFLLVR
jgi:hypothetical protein